MAEIILNIEGMSCKHCVVAVQEALKGLNGVQSSEVSIGTARVVYDESRTNTEDIKKAIQTAGYTVRG